MELLREHYKGQNRGQAQLAVFDLVGELLAITLEKHDVMVVIDSNGFSQSQVANVEDGSMVRTMVDCEEVIETDESLEITLSGAVQKDRGVLESFMLSFFFSWEKSLSAPKKRAQITGTGTNTLWLQFGRKAEQMTDSVFRVNLYRKEVSGKQLDLGQGQGLLVFGKEKSSCTN